MEKFEDFCKISIYLPLQNLECRAAKSSGANKDNTTFNIITRDNRDLKTQVDVISRPLIIPPCMV